MRVTQAAAIGEAYGREPFAALDQKLERLAVCCQRRGALQLVGAVRAPVHACDLAADGERCLEGGALPYDVGQCAVGSDLEAERAGHVDRAGYALAVGPVRA